MTTKKNQNKIFIRLEGTIINEETQEFEIKTECEGPSPELVGMLPGMLAQALTSLNGVNKKLIKISCKHIERECLAQLERKEKEDV